MIKSLILVTTLAFSQSDPLLGPAPTESVPQGLIQSGKLFTVKIVPKDKETLFYIVGFKWAGMSFKQSGLEAYVQIPGKEEKYFLKKQKDYFSLDQPLKGNIQLNLKSTQPEKQETLKFNLH